MPKVPYLIPILGRCSYSRIVSIGNDDTIKAGSKASVQVVAYTSYNSRVEYRPNKFKHHSV